MPGPSDTSRRLGVAASLAGFIHVPSSRLLKTLARGNSVLLGPPHGSNLCSLSSGQYQPRRGPALCYLLREQTPAASVLEVVKGAEPGPGREFVRA